MTTNKLVKYTSPLQLFDRDEFLTPFDSFFDDFFEKAFPTLSHDLGDSFFSKGSYPKVDIVENETDYIVEAEIPGLKKEDISVDIVDGVLVLKGEKRHEQENKSTEGKYLRRELKRSSFRRSFTVGNNVDVDNIDAKFNDGVLTVILKKLQPTKPNVKKIDIK